MATDAAVYADDLICQTVPIVENVQIAKSTFRVRFECPAIAARVTPGQFLMLRLSQSDDPLIGRPLALYQTVDNAQGQPVAIDVVYLVGGKMTRKLSECGAHQLLDVWGPLGNGFAVQDTDHLIMVAGGIGQTPFLAVAAEHLGRRSYGTRSAAPVPRVTLCYGARSADYLAGIDDFQAVGAEVKVMTDDGTAGELGLVTEALERVLEEATDTTRAKVVCCGPEPMMKAVAGICESRNVPAQVSLETPMACGIGICFTCVAPVIQQDGTTDYRRTCVEGPVFDACRIHWDTD